MKKILLVLFLIVCVAVAYIPLNNQIPSDAEEFLKEDSIKNEDLAIHQIDSMFKGSRSGKIVSVLYHNFNPKYELLTSAQKSKIDKKNELYQLYRFKPEHLTNWASPLEVLCIDIRMENSQRGKEWGDPLNGGSFYGIWQSGWALGCAKRISGDKYICYLVIPYLVGYIRQSDSFLYEFKPTIREALNTAYDFYTKNEQSDFINFLGPDHLDKFMSFVQPRIDVNNYTIEVVENVKSDFEYANPGVFEGTNYMYNGYIRVYIGMAYHTTFQLKYNKEFASWDKENYIKQQEEKLKERIISIECVLGLLLILFVIYYIVIRRKARETILDKLIKASNPKRFMKQYNQETIEIANHIYSSAKECKIEDKETIEKLCVEAETKLNICFVRNNEKKELLKRCNPKRFMKPYDAEKVTRANEIYGRIKQGKLSYSDYIKIKSEVDELYNKKSEESTSLAKPNDSSI